MGWIDDIITGFIEVYVTDNVYELYDLLEIQIIKLNKDNILLRGNDGFYQRDYFNQEIVFLANDLDYKYEKQATYFALKLLDINLNPIDFEGLSINQISQVLHVPMDCLILI